MRGFLRDNPLSFLCGEYPCARYAGEEACDSFITVQNRRAGMEKTRRIGLEACTRRSRRKGRSCSRSWRRREGSG